MPSAKYGSIEGLPLPLKSSMPSPLKPRSVSLALLGFLLVLSPFVYHYSSPQNHIEGTAATAPILGASFPSDPLPYSVSFPTTFSGGKSSPVRTIKRPSASSPGSLFEVDKSPLPTNRWYQNLLIGTTPKLTETNKAYTIPYVVDPTFSSLATPSASGLMVHWTNVAPSGDKIVQVNTDPYGSVGLGVASSSSSLYVPSSSYKISKTPSPLQLELEFV